MCSVRVSDMPREEGEEDEGRSLSPVAIPWNPLGKAMPKLCNINR